MKKYSIIYSDPPWAYQDKRKTQGGSGDHYETMTISDLKRLPVKDITHDNCMLFLWATFPNLQEALEVIQAWGFQYKTLGFSWIKTNVNDGNPFFGMGYYTKSNCEVCLLGVKGKPIKISDSISSVILAPRKKHSEKPDIVRDQIIKFCGDIHRIELFSRKKIKGWDSIGHDIDGLDIKQSLNNLIFTKRRTK